MTAWLYQMSDKEWSHEEYRTQVWEGNMTTWETRKVQPVGKRPKPGETMLLFYAANSREPGVYGWAIVLGCSDDEVFFRPCMPSDCLKMNPLWDSDISDIVNKIRTPTPRGTLWAINENEKRRILQRIAEHTNGTSGASA